MTTENNNLAGGEQSSPVVKTKPQSDYYRRNRDEINRKNRERMANDPKYAEERRAYMRQWYHDHKEKRNEYAQRYRDINYKAKPRIRDTAVTTIDRAYQVTELQRMLPAKFAAAVNHITSGMAYLIRLPRSRRVSMEDHTSWRREYKSTYRTLPTKVRRG